LPVDAGFNRAPTRVRRSAHAVSGTPWQRISASFWIRAFFAYTSGPHHRAFTHESPHFAGLNLDLGADISKPGRYARLVLSRTKALKHVPVRIRVFLDYPQIAGESWYCAG
jgi:hypothetical protein